MVVFYEKTVHKNFSKVTEKHLCQRCKETLAQVFSGKFYEIFIDRFFLEHLWGTASENST